MSSRTWRWARRSLPGCIGLALLVAPLYASALYRCQARDGTVRHTSHAVVGAHCTLQNGKTGQTSKAGATAGARSKAAPASARVDDPGSGRVRVYTFVHKGVRQYVSRRPVGIAARVDVIDVYYIKGCYLCMAPKDFNVATLRLDTRSYRREIEAASLRYGVDRALVRAVIHAESAFQPNAISIAGAQGLMQLMPDTAERFNVSDPFDARQNIRGGVRYLAWLLKRFNGNQRLALASYNAGEMTVDKYNGIPPYAETQTYVARVQSLTERYRNHP
ncbi:MULTISPECIES: lytic transglycosylase domain-containing protein [Pseudomonas]|uniref:Murein transglycosylase n=1 Tax=Pseudomonas nitroreducens TaxID=46680 RepID=A0A246F9J7_PSENT|nr:MULTISPECIES: lytic transglycosylase domain-containing protein [Pseudomonas]MDU4255202.1 lytic transglycosylase domain-containing protein [Pseudomonas sp.]OWP50931.1 murein transglycosylase [Pseudomonas nitroreducens]